MPLDQKAIPFQPKKHESDESISGLERYDNVTPLSNLSTISNSGSHQRKLQSKTKIKRLDTLMTT